MRSFICVFLFFWSELFERLDVVLAELDGEAAVQELDGDDELASAVGAAEDDAFHAGEPAGDDARPRAGDEAPEDLERLAALKRRADALDLPIGNGERALAGADHVGDAGRFQDFHALTGGELGAD